MDSGRCLKMMDSALKTMNSVSNVMDYVVETTNHVFNMMNSYLKRRSGGGLVVTGLTPLRSQAALHTSAPPAQHCRLVLLTATAPLHRTRMRRTERGIRICIKHDEFLLLEMMEFVFQMMNFGRARHTSGFPSRAGDQKP